MFRNVIKIEECDNIVARLQINFVHPVREEERLILNVSLQFRKQIWAWRRGAPRSWDESADDDWCEWWNVIVFSALSIILRRNFLTTAYLKVPFSGVFCDYFSPVSDQQVVCRNSQRYHLIRSIHGWLELKEIRRTRCRIDSSSTCGYTLGILECDSSQLN